MEKRSGETKMGTWGWGGGVPIGSGTERKPLVWRRVWIMSVTASGEGVSLVGGWRGDREGRV